MYALDQKRILNFFAFIMIVLSVHAQDLEKIKDEKPFLINGSIGLNGSFYNASGIPNRQNPYAYGIDANATISIYGIDMPFSFTWYSNDKAGFEQPFNQFGISPKYKWLTVHLGYRNLSFSEFTLNGYTFLGAGVEANPNKLRLGFVYGKFNQNSQYDLTMADSIPKLTRKGFAAKIGYGTNDRFVDLSVIRIGDDKDDYIDSLANLEQATPAQNLVLGVTSKFKITPKLFFDFDGALSYYTRNLKVEKTDSVNDNILRLAESLITINNTSEHHNAIKAGLRYKFAPTAISSIEYRRIGPDFQSMGSYFFNNDIEMLSINQTASLFKNKFNFRASLGFQRDNLNNIKDKTSSRIAGSFSGTYAINENWAIDMSYNNFSTNQKAVRNRTNDSLRVFQVNNNIQITPRYTKITDNLSHMIMLNINLMNLDDKNKYSENQTDTDTRIAMLVYNLGILSMKLNITPGITYTNMENSNFNNRLIGGSLNLSKLLLKDKLSLSTNNSFMFNELNKEKGTILNTSLACNYRISNSHSVSMNFNFIKNSFGNSTITPSFNEIRGNIRYVYTFRQKQNKSTN